MHAKFPQILRHIKQVQHQFKYFTKNYLAQLRFMEAMIRSDAKKSSNTFKWCSSDKQTQMILDLAHKYNPKFCLTFQMMSIQERQDFFLQLLQMIGILSMEIQTIKVHGFDQQKNFPKDRRHLKRHLKDKLFEQCINKGNKDYDQVFRKKGLLTFSVNAQIDGTASQQIILFDQFMIHLISKARNEESKIIIGARNYLVLKALSKPYSYRMQSIFSTIEPNIIQIQVLEKDYQAAIISYIALISKMGKIQNMVRNFELDKVQGLPQNEENKTRSGTFFNVILPHDDADSDMQNSFQPNLIARKSLIVQKKIQKSQERKKSIQQSRYQEVRKQLIQTLNILAEKKKLENEKILAFLKKELRIKTKLKSVALIEALQCKQSILYDNKSKAGFVSYLGQTVIRVQSQNEEILNKSKYLSIIGKKYDRNEQKQITNESFMSFQGNFRDIQDKLKINQKKSRTMNYREDVYSVVYPNYKISKGDYLIDYQKIQINEEIWEPSETKISFSLKNTHKKVQSKIRYLQDIIKDCKLYSCKSKKSKFKILIKQPIAVLFLVSSITDITSWFKWHPNIQQVKVIETIPEKNICNISLSCKVGKSKFKFDLTSHFFRAQNNYYLAMKCIPKEQNGNSNSSWNFFTFFKSDQQRKFDYLLIKMEKSGNDESSKIVIQLDFDQKLYQKKGRVKEQITLFLNFYFAASYWKSLETDLAKDAKNVTEIFEGKKLLNDQLFQIDWQVTSKLIEENHYWQDK